MTVTTRTIRFVATFQGVHNAIKSKCLIVLYDRYLQGRRKGLSVKQLAKLAGVSSLSVNTLIKNWYRWQYVLRDCTYPYSWRIAFRGRRWIDRHRHKMPFDRYIQEIEQANESNSVS